MVEAMIGPKECLREVNGVGDRAHALPCSLERNQIGDAGATALAEGVKHSVSLTSLWCDMLRGRRDREAAGSVRG